MSSSSSKEFSGVSTHSSKVPTSSLSTVLLSGNWPFKMRYLRHHEILSHQRKNNIFVTKVKNLSKPCENTDQNKE